MQIAGVFWRENNDRSFEKGLEVWSDGAGQLGMVPLKQGETIRWTVSGPKMCVGYRGLDGVSVRCPEHMSARKGMTRCGPCNALDGSSQCIRCNGSECRAGPERRLACSSTEYAVYLALFGSDRVKVGVSSAARLRTRWAEQGADHGVHLARVQGGMPARRLEHAIGRSRSLTKVVRGTTKMSMLLDVMEASTAQRTVDAVLGEGKITVDFIKKYGADVLEWPPRVVSLSSAYHVGDLESLPQYSKSRGSQSEGTTMIGEIVGMKGSLLVTRIADSLATTDLRQLIGYTLLCDSPDGLVTQSSLSEFV